MKKCVSDQLLGGVMEQTNKQQAPTVEALVGGWGMWSGGGYDNQSWWSKSELKEDIYSKT